MRLEYTVREEEDGRRVKDILRRSLSVSTSAMKSAKWEGRILRNGEPVFVSAVVRGGDRILAEWPDREAAYRLKPYDLPLRIPYEDEYFLVIDKPAGVASQSGSAHPDDSLENALYARFGCPEGFIYRPVNRLDKGTGGLMTAALTPHAQQLLQRLLHTPDFRRGYLAVTDGVPPEKEGILDSPIGKAPGATVRREVRADGKPSRTRYRVLGEENGSALLFLQLETGRTHQIRVHLSHIGCPVHGDFLYGREDPENYQGCFALHSAALALRHPVTGESLELYSVPGWARPFFHGGEDPEHLLAGLFGQAAFRFP